MLNEKVQKLLNEQITKEFYSAYLYLDISNWYYARNLTGFANWFSIQAQEERDHANMFLQYLLDNQIQPELGTIDAPNKKYQNHDDPLKLSLAHERYITDQIHKIHEAASEVNDLRTCNFLDWFITEQGEEEKNANDLIGKFNLFGTDPRGLYMLNAELAARVYTPASPTT